VFDWTIKEHVHAPMQETQEQDETAAAELQLSILEGRERRRAKGEVL
jgi:hypothetical protein